MEVLKLRLFQYLGEGKYQREGERKYIYIYKVLLMNLFRIHGEDFSKLFICVSILLSTGLYLVVTRMIGTGDTRTIRYGVPLKVRLKLHLRVQVHILIVSGDSPQRTVRCHRERGNVFYQKL